MKKLLFTRDKRIILKAIIVLFSLSVLSHNVFAQLPQLPLLSLGVANEGVQGTGSTDWYPDNRIWIVPSDKSLAREVIIPVFINNRWFTHSAYRDAFTTEPISSFSFKIYYNGKALEFVDLQKQHPFTEEEAEALDIVKFDDNKGYYAPPKAEHFNLSATNENVTDYHKYFAINEPKPNGKAITITGTAFSNYTLDTTDLYEKAVLLYVRFKVLAQSGTTDAESMSSYLYIDPTHILYNGINIGTDRPIKLFAKYDSKNYNLVSKFDQRSDNFAYWNDALYNPELDGKRSDVVRRLVGLSLENNIDEDQKYANEAYLPGSIMLRILPNLPEFSFSVQNPASGLPASEQIYRASQGGTTDYSTWILGDPVTTDAPLASRASDAEGLLGLRYIDVNLNPSSGYLMNDIIIESDQPWLKFKTVVPTDDYKNPIYVETRRAYIDYINKIVGVTSDNPFSSETSKQYLPDKNIRLAILCDPEEISNSDKAGIYTGYVTFKSMYDKFRPTRIKVTFIYYANPDEGNKAISNQLYTAGMHLKLTPKNGTDVNNTVNLIMGSADRATDYADTLYGEYPQKAALGKNRYGETKMFDARFFLDAATYPAPTDPALLAQWNNLVTNGFGDLAQSESNPRSNSRDIRNSKDNEKSHIYKVKFQWYNSDDFFPVVLEWDAKEIPADASIYLRHSVNGVDQYTDMKTEATPIGNDKFTYTFEDKSVREFYIEYTRGIETESDLIDNFGDPMIKANGWNFLSLPLDPLNPYYQYVFKNAINIPYLWSLNGWQQLPDGKLKPGYGYFIKYGKTVDTKFTGTRFYKINKSTYPVLLHTGGDAGGWNAVGGLSVRYPIVNPSTGDFNVRFEAFGSELADYEYTQGFGVWAYKTKEGYKEVSELYPGSAYWIKVDANSYLNLDATWNKQAVSIAQPLPNKTAGFDRLTIADNAQNIASLYATAKHVDANAYQLPPVPGDNIFDVRYATGNYVTNNEEAVVQMNGITYPVSVNIENAKAEYSIVDVITGYVYGTVKAGESKSVVINSSRADAFKLKAVASENTGLFVNVGPNPIATNNADMTFGIEEAGRVTIVLYNSLGDAIATLVDRDFNAGIHNRVVNLENVPSGNYTVHMIAGDKNTVCRINVIK